MAPPKFTIASAILQAVRSGLLAPTILQAVRSELGFDEGHKAHFARVLGVSPRTYRRYESGEMTVPQPVIRLVWMLHNRGVPKDWR